ncbi:MAG: protein translocase subunit SecD [Bacteroidota bacterium]|nr:protein translocase subunit SecD [Bacteroidota bacterium]
MKKYAFRIFLILALILLAGYYLYPTWKYMRLEGQRKNTPGGDSAFFAGHEAEYRDARAKRIKLGLDLQGGMYVTLEVNIRGMLEKMARKQDEALTKSLEEAARESEQSDETMIDILRRKFDERNDRLSRYYGDLRNSNSEIASMLKDEADKAVVRALEIIRNRIDKYGVSEVSITRSGSRRIIVELPGVSNEREVRQLIQETAQLEFTLLADQKVTEKVMDNLNKLLAGMSVDALLDTTKAAKDTAAADTTGTAAAGDTTSAEKDTALERAKKEVPFYMLFAPYRPPYADAEGKERINRVLQRPDVKRIIPPDVKFAWTAKPRRLRDQAGEYELYELHLLKATPELTGEVITNARAQTSEQGFGQPIVTMEMNADGAREWARITGENVGKQVAIVLDGAVFSAPNVKQKIIGGNSMIEGMDNMEEARLLEIVLKAGALPAPVEIIEERTVGPSLGEDSIRKGTNSFLIGALAVLLFMVFYYRFAGMTADIAVVFNIVFILGILAAFHATLTLPGIAGMLLTVGMAVDANVLINERIREESETGKTLRAAIDAGYSRAMPAIIDSNITTLITCFILYQLGSGPVQGFALTLMIGLLCSLFTAIVMTRVIMEITLDLQPKLVTYG